MDLKENADKHALDDVCLLSENLVIIVALLERICQHNRSLQCMKY